MYRHISGLGTWVPLILLIHELPSSCVHTQEVLGESGSPGRAYVFTFLFTLQHLFLPFCFTTLSLGFSFLKYRIKPWVFIIHHLEQLRLL